MSQMKFQRLKKLKDDSSPDISEDEDLAIENDENVVSNSSHPIKPAHFQSGGQLDFKTLSKLGIKGY